jgi:hypothetical protein
MSSSLIEQTYFEAWGKAGGSGRVRRAFSLFATTRKMLELQVKSLKPGLSKDELTRQTAKRVYGADPTVQQLLDRADQATMLTDDFPETVERIERILNEVGIRHHITGGIAASFYGDPRYTQDLDFVVDLAANDPEAQALLDRLSTAYLINKDVANDAIARRSLFQAVDLQSMIKIDFHVGGNIPGELDRSTRREIAPGLFAQLVSKEDAVVSKLLGITQGSEKGRHDVREMLRREEYLDRARLNHLAAKLGVQELLDELDAEMRAGFSPS